MKLNPFKKKLPLRNFTIDFDSNYEENLIAMVKNAPNTYEITSCSIHFPQEILESVDSSINAHMALSNVAYEDYKQILEIVGESFHAEAINEVLESVGVDTWLAGLLMPEPLNPFDPNAVALVLIYKNKEKNEFSQVLVGYLAKEMAKKVHKKILLKLNLGLVIPVLAKLKGDSASGSGIGVLAMAMTKQIKFP